MKHVDVIAIALLLAGAALYSQVRNLSVIQVAPMQRVALARTIQRAVQCGSVRAQRAIQAAHASAAAHSRIVVVE
jgi:hypothetical protein